MIAVIGCGRTEEIRTYRVATGESPVVAPATPAVIPSATEVTAGEPTDRMLAAVIAGAEKVWFLKATAPLAAVTEAEDQLRVIYNGFDASGEQPRWELPDGWSEERPGGMRLATLRREADGTAAPLEVSVIGLPKTGDWRSQLLDNVNRWRGQMAQPPLTAANLSDSVSPLGEAENERVLVDIAGRFSGGMQPSSAPPTAPVAAPPPAARGGGLEYDIPEGWTDQPGSAMRKASFKTAAGCEVTAFVFAAGGGMSDTLGNVNRWRGQVGLEPTTAGELDAESEPMPLAGGDATYVELVGEESTTLAAISERDGSVWFFKLNGPNDAAAADRDAFRGWLASLRF